MNILYISNDYGWGSYGVLRNYYETLRKHHTVDRRPAIGTHYDMVWYMNYNSAPTPADLTHFRKVGTQVACFGLSDASRFTPSRITACDQYHTNALTIYEDYKDTGKVFYLPPTCNQEWHKPLPATETIDVLFIGAGVHPFVTNRVETVNKLLADGVKIKVFGIMWPTAHPITGDALIQTINNTRLGLDLLNSTASIGRRILEYCFCGKPALTYRRADTQTLFEEDKEILLYSSYDEMLAKIKDYLQRPDDLLRIGVAAREKCLAAYTTEHGVQAVLEKRNLIGGI